jgi:hypothetical protein
MPLVDQDLLVVHRTAIQGYGHARMTCSMVKDLALNRPLTNGALERGSRRAPASRSSSSTKNHTPIGAFKVREARVRYDRGGHYRRIGSFARSLTAQEARNYFRPAGYA